MIDDCIEGLDPEGTRNVEKGISAVIAAVREQSGTTVLIATNRLRQVERADTILYIKNSSTIMSIPRDTPEFNESIL